MIPALLDCDTGHDDAMAILMAGRRLDLRGVTTVFGNATVADTTDNTCRILELAGLAHVPVAAGAAAPLEGAFVHEAGVHGMTGMDGHDLPPPAGGAIDEPAVDFIARNGCRHQGTPSRRHRSAHQHRPGPDVLSGSTSGTGGYQHHGGIDWPG